MPSKKPFIFSYNTGNDNTAVHMDAPCPVKDVPIYFAIIDGNLYVSMGIARRLYGNAIAGNYLRGKVKEEVHPPHPAGTSSEESSTPGNVCAYPTRHRRYRHP